jgi:hypothetical protein
MLVILALAHLPLAAGPNTADWIAAIAEAVTALSVIGVFLQIWDTRKTTKSERTRGFQERYQADDFISSASRTVGSTGTRDAGECIDVIEAWSNRQNADQRVLPRPGGGTKASIQDIDKTLSLFEEMGTAYKLKQLDKKTLHLSFAVPTLQVFTTAWWLICWRRNGYLGGQKDEDRVEDTYLEYQNMCLKLMENVSWLAADESLQPKPGIRALCVPAGAGEKVPDRDLWRASRRLSLALSDFVRRTDDRDLRVGNALSILAADVESLPLPSRPRHLRLLDCRPPRRRRGAAPRRDWKVILVPKTIDQPCDDDWMMGFSACARLGSALKRFEDPRSLAVAVSRMERAARTST